MAANRIAPTLSPVDVLDRVLDKGIVIDAEIRIAVVGIELLTVTALVRIASFDTWDRHVAATERRARRRLGRPAAPADAPDAARVRLRCAQGCTFERRASALVIRDGVLDRQRCALASRRACAVAVLPSAV
jgi:hypothetical protein